MIDAFFKLLASVGCLLIFIGLSIPLIIFVLAMAGAGNN